MKKLIFVFLASVLLAGCATREKHAFAELLQRASDYRSEKAEQALPPSAEFTPREVIEQFLELQYQAYTSLKNADYSRLMDMSQIQNRNETAWLGTLILRRKLIAENRLCYVETRHFPYTIHFDREANDERMEFWGNEEFADSTETVIHFTITGEKGRAYPPFFAVNAQHTMKLKQTSGGWVINFHYYPGSERKFGRDSLLEPQSKQELLKSLQNEFCKETVRYDVQQTDPLPGFIPYNSRQAVRYAKTYTETPNPAFYRISDWMGNCSNFTSQCIWYGFSGGEQGAVERRDEMTGEWFAGSGGGSPEWENVEHFWAYASKEKKQGLKGDVVDTILQLKPGGLIQVCASGYEGSGEGYNHSLLLVDQPTLMLAQNTPDCFVYYSDLANAEMRFFNPKYLIP